MKLPASHIKPKDIIILDCGYQCQSDYINCKVLEVREERCLFNKDEKLISFFVEQKDRARTRFYTVGFKPTDVIEVFSVYTKPVPRKGGISAKEKLENLKKIIEGVANKTWRQGRMFSSSEANEIEEILRVLFHTKK